MNLVFPAAGKKTGQVMSWTGWSGANYSTRRGYVDLPTLDTSKLVTGYARRAIMRKALWCFGNTGIGRRCTRGVAGLIGFLIPMANTDDEEFNEAAYDLFLRRLMIPGAFDVCGKWDWIDMQINMNASRLRDGDFLIVFSENAAGKARFAFYEAGQIRTPKGCADKDGWDDGVQTDRLGRHLAYGVAEYGAEDVKVVDAANAILFADFERRGQRRGMSALQHAVDNMLDKVETHADTKTAIKVAAQFGVYEQEPEVRTVRSAFPGFSGGGFVEEFGAGDGGVTGSTCADPCVSMDAAGDKKSAKNDVERVLNAGYIARMEKGAKLETLHDDRPGPNQKVFWDEIIRDISWGVGVSPAVIWDISALTGPGVRYSLNETDGWCSREQRLMQKVLRVMWVYTLAKEIKAGGVPMPKDPEWWAVDWISPPRLSIDSARDGNLRMQQIRAGLSTLRDWYMESKGGNWKWELQNRAEEVAYMKKVAAQNGLDAKEAFPDFFKAGGN